MAARLRYPELAPEGYAALRAFGHYVNTATALEPVLLGLVYLRASVLNGCHFCIEMHKAELRKHHEPDSRIAAVVSAPASDAFTGRERAALRWTEVITRLGAAGAGDAEFTAISEYFAGKELVDLTFAIANINAWNRMGVAFQPAWRPGKGESAPRPTESSPEQRVAEQGADAGAEGAAGAEHTRAGEVAEAEAADRSAPTAQGKQVESAGGTALANGDDGGKVGQD